MQSNPIYALPTLLTLGNLLCGFFAIVTLHGKHALRVEIAIALIFLAMLLDGIDGLAARRLRMESRFGALLDSLADLVSFGVAPAMLLLELTPLDGMIGLSVAGWLLCATALRLARFTAKAENSDNAARFEGLPCPAAAGVLAAAAWADITAIALAPIAVVLGVLMVSLIPYEKPAAWLAGRQIGFTAAAVAALLLALTVSLGGFAPLAVCVLFVLSPARRILPRFFEQKETKEAKY